MNEEIEKELESFLSSISPEDLKDMVDEFDSEFERGDFSFGSATDFMFEIPQVSFNVPTFSVGCFENPIEPECNFVKAA